MRTSDFPQNSTSLPTLARLSFRVPPERMAEFKTAYDEKVAPALKQHGLVTSSERPRMSVAGVFSRLFEVESPTEIIGKQEVLQADPAWHQVLRDLGTIFETVGSGGLIQHSFRLYAAPAVPGKVVLAGEARGYWRTYDAADGLAENYVWSILQDQEGNMWFGTESGVSRYHGEIFTTFTTQDGLAHNTVFSIIQDREGDLWFGTLGGVSCYDGSTFTTFTTQDGLAHNEVYSSFQDREGGLWK